MGKKKKKNINSNQITELVVEIILLSIPTMILGGFFITSIDWWLSFKSGDLISYIKNEEYIYLFSSIAYILQLILAYSLALYYKLKVNKKVLRCFCLVVSVLGLASLIASFTIDYNLYHLTYMGDVTPFVMYVILFYLPITPTFLIHIFDRYKLKNTKK